MLTSTLVFAEGESPTLPADEPAATAEAVTQETTEAGKNILPEATPTAAEEPADPTETAAEPTEAAATPTPEASSTPQAEETPTDEPVGEEQVETTPTANRNPGRDRNARG